MGVSTPVIGREGLLRLVEWAGRLRARDPEGGEAARAARASSPDDGAGEGPEDGTVDVVSGGDPERRSGIAEHAPGAAGGLAHAGGGGAFSTLMSRSGCGDASGRGTAPDLRAGVGGGGGVRVL